MLNIEVAVLHEAHECPAGMMTFLAKLTQRGHTIRSMYDLKQLYSDTLFNHNAASYIAGLPHGTIKRFTPITIAIVGASRRFLAQARTHQVGMNYVSASLQYSDYSDKGHFVVPYNIISQDASNGNLNITKAYLHQCNSAMDVYKDIAQQTDNDTAGYVAPQGLRNILIMQGNHEAWMHFIRLRGCNRNTDETQYVTMLIWEALLNTADSEELFKYAGPDCIYGKCREGKMCCGKPLEAIASLAEYHGKPIPRYIIEQKWPLLAKAHECRASKPNNPRSKK